jgi:hypothetical protein
VVEEIERLVVRMAEENPAWATDASRGLWRIWGIASTRLQCVTSCVTITWNPLRDGGKLA